MNNYIRTSILASIILVASFSANAQMECRSTLGAHLTQFHKNIPIYWAIEGTMAPGIMTSPFNDTDETKLNGGMVLGALDIGLFKNNSIYIEGGYKNWKTSELVHENEEQAKRNIGMRQVFYNYSGTNTNLKFGLHEAKLGNFPLLDERILGLSVDQNIGAFKLNVRAGTVMKNFARMGVFCVNRHLYGVISPNYTENIGKKPGDTNLAGFAINWNPQYVKPKKANTSDDEFSMNEDEFSEFSEFSDEFSETTTSKQNISVTNVSLIVYNEFGNANFIPNHKLYLGSIVDIDLPYGVFAQTGGFYQNMQLNNTVIYLAKIGKNFTWGNASNTKVSAAYIGKTDIDNNALYQPLFSNLFLGEIMRLDVADFPLWQAAIRHKFPGKLKLHLGFKAVGQIEGNKTNEQDIEVGIVTLKKHLKLTLIGSRVQTQALPNEFYMGRVEMRLAF